MALQEACADFYNADKAGILALHSRTGIAGTDATPVNLATNARPTDRVILGGAKQDLYIVVVPWTNMTSAAVRLIGTDTAGNAQTEDLSLTGNGIVYATKYFKTLTQTQVMAFSGTGSFNYTVTQAQWGVVWNPVPSCYAFGCRLVIGDGSTSTVFTEKNKQIIFLDGSISANSQNLFYVRNGATFTLGYLTNLSRKQTKDGCQILDLNSTYYGYIVNRESDASANAYCYSSAFATVLNEGYLNATRIWNCFCDHSAYPQFSNLTTCDINNLIVTGAYGIRRCKSTMTLNNLLIGTEGFSFWNQTYPAIVKNVYARGSETYGAYTQNQDTGVSADSYLINADLGAWTFKWIGNNGKLTDSTKLIEQLSMLREFQ